MQLSVRGDYRGDSKVLIIKVEGFTLSFCPAVTFMRELPFASLLAGRGQQFVCFYPYTKWGADKKLLYGSGCPRQCLSSAKLDLVPAEAPGCPCLVRMQVIKQKCGGVAYLLTIDYLRRTYLSNKLVYAGDIL